MQPQMQPATTLGRATPERIFVAGEGGVETDPTGRQRVVASPLDRLRASGFITQREFDAGDKLRADAYLAAIDPGAMTVDWSATGGGFSARVPSIFQAQHIADARIRFRQVQRIIGGVVWDALNLAIVLERDLDIVGRNLFGTKDAREGYVAGRAGVRVALGALADVYERRA